MCVKNACEEICVEKQIWLIFASYSKFMKKILKGFETRKFMKMGCERAWNKIWLKFCSNQSYFLDFLTLYEDLKFKWVLEILPKEKFPN